MTFNKQNTMKTPNLYVYYMQTYTLYGFNNTKYENN